MLDWSVKTAVICGLIVSTSAVPPCSAIILRYHVPVRDGSIRVAGVGVGVIVAGAVVITGVPGPGVGKLVHPAMRIRRNVLVTMHAVNNFMN